MDGSRLFVNKTHSTERDAELPVQKNYMTAPYVNVRPATGESATNLTVYLDGRVVEVGFPLFSCDFQ